jgi:glycosyltransferase involved in cell wall biosynthesis
MKKIKVAMLGPYLEKHDSIAIHTNLLTKHLSKIVDVELHVITIGNENGRFKKGNIGVHVVKKKILYPFGIPGLVQRLRHEIIKINPDIVHAVISGTSYSAVVIPLRKKYPTLLSVRGIISKEAKFKNGIPRIFDMLIEIPSERYILSKIPNIIVCSPQMKEMVGERTSSKIYVIPNGVDFDYIQNIQSQNQLKHPSILFVGGLRKVKGIDLLLRAVPIIGEKTPNLHLYVAGSGREEKKLKRLVKELKIEKKVKFLGFVSGNEKYVYYKSVDICVFPSLYEPFGVVIVEAMACGKPVVASRVGGIPFVVEDGKSGLLFESENVEELAEKVILLLEDKELRAKMGEAGRERARGFTWERSAEMTVDVYKEVIENFKYNNVGK